MGGKILDWRFDGLTVRELDSVTAVRNGVVRGALS